MTHAAMKFGAKSEIKVVANPAALFRPSLHAQRVPVECPLQAIRARMGMGGPATSRFNGNLHLHFCARHDREDRRNSLSDFRFFGTAALDFLCECHYEFGPG